MNSFKLAVCLAGVPLLPAQTTLDLKSQSRNVDFAQASTTRPVKTGAVLPANCSTGELFYLLSAQPGKNLYGCVSTGIWASQGGGGGSTLAPGTEGGVIVSSDSNSTTIDVDPAWVMTMGGNNHPFGNMTPAMGNWDLTNVGSLILRSGTTDPPGCGIGEVFMNMAGTPVLKTCTALNSWSVPASTSGAKVVLNGRGAAGVTNCTGAPIFTYSIPANAFAANSILGADIMLAHTGTNGGPHYWASLSGSQVTASLTTSSNESWAKLRVTAYLGGDGSALAFSQAIRQNNAVGFDYRNVAVDLTSPMVFTVSADSCVGSDTVAVDWVSITSVR